MSRKKIIPIVPKYYLHYNKNTNVIYSVSNEKTVDHESSLEISFDDYKEFIEGRRNTSDYEVIVHEGVERLIQISDPLNNFTFKNKLFEWINSLPTSDTDLIINWNKKLKCWEFSLSKDVKSRLPKNVNSNAVFFVTLADDFDFLINTIVINVKELANTKTIKIPFSSKIEEQIDKISLSTVRYFNTYGLTTHD